MAAKHTLLFDGELTDKRTRVNAVLKSEWPDVAPGQGGRIVIVIDASGSMSYQNKLRTATKAAKMIHELMPKGYEFELVTYGSTARVHAKPGDKINPSIFDKILTNGGTNLEAGLTVALNTNREYKTSLPTTFIVMTDGEINEGRRQTPSSLNTLIRLHPEAVNGQWRLIGIGSDYSEGFMSGLSEVLPNCISRHCTAETVADTIGELVGMAFTTAGRHIQNEIVVKGDAKHVMIGDPLHIDAGRYLLPAAAGGSTTYCTFGVEGTSPAIVSAFVTYRDHDNVLQEIEVKPAEVKPTGVDEVIENVLRIKVVQATATIPHGAQGVKVLDELIAELKASPVADRLDRLITMCEELKQNAANPKACFGMMENLRTQSGSAYCTPGVAQMSMEFSSKCGSAPARTDGGGVSSGEASILKLREALNKRERKRKDLEDQIKALKKAGAPPDQVTPLIDELNRMDAKCPPERTQTGKKVGWFDSMWG